MMVKEEYKEVRVGTKVVEIPKEWEIMNLDGLSKNKGQYGANESANEFDENEYRYLRITDITEDGRLSDDDKKSIKKNDKNKKYILEPGDIVFARTGSVGRTYLFKEKDLTMPTAFAGYLIKFKLDKEITNYEYLFHYTHSFLYKSWINSFSRSTTLANINAGEYRDLPVIYPPLPEQKKIASTLSSVDKSIEKTDEVIEETKELKKGLMQELLTKGIGHSEFKEVLIGVKKFNIPKSWELRKTESFANEFISGGTPSTDEEDFWNGDIHFITGAYIKNREIEEGKDLISKKGLENSSSNLIPKDNVIICTRTAVGNIGKNLIDIAISQDVTGIFLDKDKVDVDYFIWSIIRFKYLLKVYQQGSTIKGITRNVLKNFKIPLPPLEEQKKIASILSSVDAKIKKEEEYKTKLERLKKGLMQKLLTGEIRVNTEMEV